MNWPLAVAITSWSVFIFWVFLSFYCRTIFEVSRKKNRPLSKLMLWFCILGTSGSLAAGITSSVGAIEINNILTGVLFIAARLFLAGFGIAMFFSIKNIYSHPELFLGKEMQQQLALEYFIDTWKVEAIIRRFIDGK